jgi:hypothetical protein
MQAILRIGLVRQVLHFHRTGELPRVFELAHGARF